MLREFGFEAEMEEIETHERAYSLYQGALRLFRRLELDRIHVHNLGYYVMVLRKPYPVTPEEVRQACLYASSVNAMKAKYGGYVTREQLEEAAEMRLSDIGFEQLAGGKGAESSHPQAANLLTEDILSLRITPIGGTCPRCAELVST